MSFTQKKTSCSLNYFSFFIFLYFLGCELKWKVHFFLIFQDQLRSLDMIRDDPELSNLAVIQAPLVDVEIRGVPALKFLGDIIWK